MTDGISLGNVTSTNGSFRLSGTSSNLETEAIVEAAYEAKRLGAVRLERKIETNDAKIAAYNDLKSILTDVKNAVDGLRNPPGFFGADDNVFENKQVFLSSSGAVSPDSLVGITAENSAQAGRFDLRIDQIAKANKVAAGTTSSATESLAVALNGGAAFSGTLDIGLDGGASASVAVDGTMTIADLRSAINAVSDTTGVSASVLQVSDSDFRLVLNANETNKAIQITDNSGITGGFPQSDIQAPEAAQFTIDGVTMTRDSNEVSDAVSGVTFSLFKADAGTTMTVEVEPSLQAAKDRIVDFVNTYNTFRDFVDQQSVVGEGGELGEGSVLFGDATLRRITSEMSALVGDSVGGLDAGALSTLRDVGITLDGGNRLKIDDTKLDSELIGNIDELRNIFEFRSTSIPGTLTVAGRSNSFANSDFAVDIVDADNDGVPESATIDGIAAEIQNQTIRAPEGSAYDGLTFFWSGTGSQSVSVETSQGLADRMFNRMDDYLASSGDIQTAIDAVEDSNEDFSEDIARITERAEAARDLLIEKFAAMEAALSLANSMLEQVKAQSAAWNGGG